MNFTDKLENLIPTKYCEALLNKYVTCLLTVCMYLEWKSGASRRNSNPGWVSTISLNKDKLTI